MLNPDYTHLIETITSRPLPLCTIAGSCLLIEAIVDMRPEVAALLRSAPIVIGGAGAWAFYNTGDFIMCAAFGFSAFLSLFARFVVRDYWDAVKRFAVNWSPLLSYGATAALFRWLRLAY
jgi:hypothetical protein